MLRGEVWWARLAEPIGKRPVLLLSRDRAIQVRTHVTVAPLTRTIRNLPTEVILEISDGPPKRCAVNADSLLTIEKASLLDFICALGPVKMAAVARAVRFALDV